MHHAIIDVNLDKNYGGILIVWDRLFGTFHEESHACDYGTRARLKSWLDKGRVWLKPPGWRPAELEARFPKSPFDLSSITTYNPPLSRATQWAAAALFLVLLQGVSLLLWFADQLPSAQLALGSALMVAGYWCVGKLMGVRF